MSVDVHYEVVYSGYPPPEPTEWSGEVFRVAGDERWGAGHIKRSPSEEHLVGVARELARIDRRTRDRIVTLRLDLDDEAWSDDGSGPMGF